VTHRKRRMQAVGQNLAQFLAVLEKDLCVDYVKD
jgi:hypothetical protein